MELTMSNIYRNYWAEAGTRAGSQERAPRAGFQTLWVQQQLEIIKKRNAAMRSQYISPSDIF